MTKEEKGRRKGKKGKDTGHGGHYDGSNHSADSNNSIEMEQAEVSAEISEKPYPEHAEGVMSESSVKKDKKKKKKDKEVETVSQKEILDANENVGSGLAERNKGQREHDRKLKKRKRKHQDGETASDGSCDQTVLEEEKRGKLKECLVTLEDDNKVDMSRMEQKTEGKKKRRKEKEKKDKKKERKDKEVETVCLKETLDANENVGSAHAERNKGQREHDRKSKMRKRKHQDGETASNGSCDQTVLGKENRRKMKECLVTLEEDNKVDMSKMEQKTEGKKKRRKEKENVGVDLRQNTTGRVGKNSNKEKTKCEDGNDGGEREKENIAKRKDKGRRVSFTDDVEVFNIDSGDGEEGDASGESELVHGRRFTPEEDEKLMEAIVRYAEMKQLREKGLEMIRSSIKHPEVRGCWAEIATSLPHRPVMAVYKRARILLYRSAERKWSPEEYEIVRRFVEKNGTNWKKLATELGKSEIHVKDTWRRMKPKNLKKGAWTQDEYQNLFDLVNLDLRVKAHQNSDPGHRQLRDNISWEAISEKLSTRSNKDCCLKWYHQLASPLVKEGIWADTDDYLLVEALQKVDAVCVEDVDWESLLDHRSGELCRRRWNQMVRLIGDHREKPFIEQVDVLARRYCPEMLDYRKSKACELSADELAGGSDL